MAKQMQIRKGYTESGNRKESRNEEESDLRTPSGKKLPY